MQEETKVQTDLISKIKEKSPLAGLISFLKDNAIIGMAIGVVVAQIVKDLVDSIVKGIFLPLISLVVPGGSLSQLVYVVNGVDFNVGVVLNSLLTFLIIMTLLYVVVKKILKMEDVIVKK